ncbi:MFS transporter [Paenibacillus qinlingensis]|uniref:DHA3 family macrolide efflux protein-like MFS transporter n=1 Tax=Paenibacillus qinlingensis TaxID=1837343 RepID=A0ABU1NXE0_9BACL|nr:MFS transporter [Paenibacillus qinlingensis]MDR6551657.1 DHA3 family macrolide efflux protein-like MFS transporter [Paenibacillus qinlingensis]
MELQWRKTFAIIFSGQIFSILTSSMVQFSIIWHLTETTGSAAVLMIAGLAAFLPQAILGPFIGVWLDRWNRKKTMIVADSAIAFFSLILGIYFFFGEPSLGFVYVILMIRSTASAFHAPAFQAAIPLIAPEDQLTRVAGWHQMVFSFSTVIGPALGIAVYSATSLGAVLFLDVVGALIANIMLSFVKIRQPKAESIHTPSFLKEFKLGWDAFVQVKPIVVITLATTIFGIAFMPLATLFPFMTLSHFGRGGYSASLIEAVFSIGMVLGGVILSVIASKWKDITYMSLSLVVIGLTCLISGVLSKEAFLLFVILSFFMGSAAPFYNGPFMAMIQRAYEPAMLGRVISLVTSVMMLSSPIGLMLAGPTVDKYGVQMWFFWSGIIVIVTGVILFIAFKRMTVDLVQRNSNGLE